MTARRTANRTNGANLEFASFAGFAVQLEGA